MEQESIRHLFQQEFSKMVAVITRMYGLPHIEVAEDIVSETFLAATETWGQKGLPPNPTAWLYMVAKQKTLYYFRRNRIYDEKVMPELRIRQEEVADEEVLSFSTQEIRDSQLQMIFAVCNPVIASEAQIGLALRILCGFGIDEIAEAFLSNKETINKRLFRAKEKLRTENIKMELPAEPEIGKRLVNVLHVIYLLFSEGYYSRTQNRTLQKELCFEALRLGVMLTEYALTNQPQTNALIALMCFHASRFNARQAGDDDALILYDQQNESLWDQQLIGQGRYYLHQATQGSEISSFHLEAFIAHWHCIREDSAEKWKAILNLYDQLLQLNYSPGAALNRLFALYKAEGPQAALAEALKLNASENHFYHLLLGELYKSIDKTLATDHLKRAHDLARTHTEQQEILQRIAQL